MSYRRVVRKKGKSYGPYIYESYRDKEGRVKKRYLGKVEEKKKSVSLNFFVFVLLSFLSVLSLSYTTYFLFSESSGSDINLEFGGFYSSVVDGLTGLVTGETEIDLSEDINEGDLIIEEDVEDFYDDEDITEEVEEILEEEINDSLVEENLIESENVGGNETDFVEENISEEILKGETINDSLDEEILEEENISVEINESLADEINDSLNETINEDENITLEINESLGEDLVEEILEGNESVLVEDFVEEINESFFNESFISNVSVFQFNGVAGFSVRWVKVIELDEGSLEVIIELPENAENISVLTRGEIKEAMKDLKDYEKVLDKTEKKKEIVSGVFTGNVVYEVKSSENILSRFWSWVKGFTISGNVVRDLEIKGKVHKKAGKKFVNLTDFAVYEEEVAIEYYTPAPIINESDLINGKRIFVSADSSLNYSDILAYTNLSEKKILMEDADKIKVYWYTFENISEEIEDFEKINESLVEEINENISEENISEEINDSLNETINEDENITLEINESLDELNESLEGNESVLVEEINEENETSLAEDFVEEIIEEGFIEEVNETEFGSLITGKSVYGFEELDFGDSLDEKYLEGFERLEIPFEFYDLDEDGFVDYVGWIVPHFSVQIYDVVVGAPGIGVNYVTRGDEVQINVSANTSGSGNTSTFIDWDNSLVSWWRMDDVVGVGSNMVSNGEFTTGLDGWSNTGAWAVSMGVAGLGYGTESGNLSQDLGIEAGKSYELTYSISSPVGTNYIIPYLGGAAGNTQTTTGTYTEIITSQNTENLTFFGSVTSGSLSLDNVVVKEIELSDYMGRNNGTLVGTVAQIDDGYMGKAFEFGGDDDRVSIGGSWHQIPTKTISFWAKPNCMGDNLHQMPIATGGNYYISFYDVCDQNRITISISNASNTQRAYSWTGEVIPNEWHHYVAVFDVDGMNVNRSLFVDGKLEGTYSFSEGYGTNYGSTFNIGALSTNYEFNGSIDDVMFFNRTLSAEEISGIYANTSSRFLSETYEMASERNYTFTAYAQDTDGDVDSSGEIIVSRDVTGPTLNIIQPQNNSYYNGQISVNASSADDFPVSVFSDYGLVSWWRMDDESTELVKDGNFNVVNATDWLLGGNPTHLTADGNGFLYVWFDDSPLYISQEINIVSGKTYNVSIAMVEFDNDYDYDVDVYLGGTHAGTFSRVGAGYVQYNYSYIVEAGSSAPNITINFDGNSWENIVLTTISVKEVGGVIDYMGRNPGTVVGNASQTEAGYMGKGFSFDGDGDLINLSINDIPDGADPRTYSFWINTNYLDDGIYYAFGSPGVGNGNWFMVNWENRSISLTLGGHRVSTPAQGLSADTWYHVVVRVPEGSIDTDDPEIFINGVNQTLSYVGGATGYPWTLNTTIEEGDLTVGGNPTYSSFFNGTIDDVMIFNRSLSVSEIVGLYANSSTKYLDSELDLPSGTSDLTFYAQDRAGNIGTDTVYNLTYDTSAPVVVVENPEDNTYFNGEVNANSSSSDNLDNSLFMDYGLVSWWRMDDFEENIVTNSNLTSQEGWTKEGFWSDNGGEFYWTDDAESAIDLAYQNLELIEGETYRVTFDVTSFSDADSSSYFVSLNDGSGDYAITSSGSKVYDIVATSYDLGVYFNAQSGIGGINNDYIGIDNVEVRLLNGVNDYMGRNHGIAEGNAVQTDAGYFGKGFEFDGVNSYVDLGTPESLNFSGTPNLTISTWIKADSFPTFAGIVGNSLGGAATTGRFDFHYYGSDLRLCLGNGTSLSCQDTNTNVINELGRWYHAVVVMNDTNYWFYVDGVQNGAIKSIPFEFISSSQSWKIGKAFNSASYQWNGTIDDVMIFNRSLSASEIAALYANTSSQYLDTLITLDSGKHDITFYSQDRSSNVGSLTVYNVTMDTTEPTVTINSPLEKTYGHSNINFNVTSSEEGTGSIIPNLDNSLVSWWRMDDANTTHVLDYLGNYLGVVSGNAVQTDSGYFGKGFEFGGYISYDEITFSDLDYNPTEATYSLWVKPKDISDDYQGVFSSNEDGNGANDTIILYQAPTDGTFRMTNDYGISVTPAINVCNWSNNEWYHIVMVVSNSSQNASIYSNNVYCGSDTSFSFDSTSAAKYVLVGSRASGWSFNGTIDDVMIFNKTLTVKEISALYNATAINYDAVLDEGAYESEVFVQDRAGNVGNDSVSFSIDTVSPIVDFVSPSPENGGSFGDYISLNLSVVEDNDYYSFVDFNNSLVGYWRGENGASDESDSFLSLDGSGDYVHVSDDDSISFGDSSSDSAFSLSGWFLFNEMSSAPLFEKEDEYQIWYGAADKLNFALYDDSTGGALLKRYDFVQTSFEGEWVYIVGTYDGSGSSDGLKLYFNGGRIDNLVLDSGSYVAMENTASDLLIGKSLSYSLNFNGSMDNIMVFNRSLSENEIEELYGVGRRSKYIGYDGLVSAWLMDSQTSSYVTDSVGGNDGTFMGDAEVVGANSGSFEGDASVVNEGKFGKGFSFDGSGDKIAVSHNANQLLTNGGTISAWIYLLDYGGSNYGRIVDKATGTSAQGGFHYYVAGGPQLAFNINAGTARSTASSVVPLNTWRFVTVTWNSSGYVTHYVNGLPSGTSAIAGSPSGITTTNSLTIGDRSEATDRSFNGTIDEVMIFNRALGPEEIMSLYNSTRYEYQIDDLTDSVYTFTGYAVDSAGNKGESEGYKVSVDDSTIPFVSIVYPVEGVYSNYVSDLNYTYIDSDAGHCWYSTDLGVTNSSAVVSGINWSGISGISEKGANELRLYCNNSYGNENSSSVSFEVDDENPLISFVEPTPEDLEIVGEDSIFVNVSSSDAIGNVSTFIDFDNSLVSWWRMDDGPFMDYEEKNVTLSGAGTPETNGEYLYGSYYAYSGDFVGFVKEGNFVDHGDSQVIISYSDNQDIYADESLDSDYVYVGRLSYGYGYYVSFIPFYRILLSDFNEQKNSWIVVSSSPAPSSDYRSSLEVLDYTGRNHGTVVGNAVQTDAGKIGKAFEFDGDGDYLSVGDLGIVANGNVTISGWYYFDLDATSKGVYNVLFRDNTDNILYQHNANNKLYIPGAEYFHVVPTLNEWHHIVLTYSGDTSTALLYYDGAKYSVNVQAGASTIAALDDVIIGGLGNNYAFNGSIDDVMVFNRSLSESEILGLYANSSSKYLGVNFSDLEVGNHTFKAYTQDMAGNLNSTEERTVYTDSSYVGGCRELNESNKVYTLYNNVTTGIGSNCLVVAAENVTLDCAGNTIDISENYAGVYSDQINTTIKNCNISMGVGNNGVAISLVGSNGSYVFNNTLYNSNRGLYLFNSHNVLIEKNLVEDMRGVSYGNIGAGIYLDGSNDNNLTGNIANNNFAAGYSSAHGFYLISSSNNNLENNTANNNTCGSTYCGSSGIVLQGSLNNNLTNTISNSNYYYGVHLSLNSNNNILSNITANSNSWNGIYLILSSNNEIKDFEIQNCSSGGSFSCIYLYQSSSGVSENNLFENGHISSGSNLGIHLYGIGSGRKIDNNIFKNIVIENIDNSGVYLQGYSDGNRFENLSLSNIGGVGFNIGALNSGNEIVNNSFSSVSGVDYYVVDGSVDEFSFVSNSLEVDDATYGNVRFLEDVSESGSDLSSVIAIGNNDVYVDSLGYSGFNVSANVTIRGLSLLEPKVIVDFNDDSSFEDCLDCVNLSYSGGEFKFNVSHFTTYKAGEASSLFGCGEISSPGVYLLERNLTTTGTCFTITADNVTLDGNGYSLSGAYVGKGIDVDGRDNVNIKNFKEITTFYHGVALTNTNNSKVINSSSNSNSGYGFYLEVSSGNNLTNLTANSNWDAGFFIKSTTEGVFSNLFADTNTFGGVFLFTSSENNFSGLDINYSGVGLYLYSSSANNVFSDVNITRSGKGTYLEFHSNNNQFIDFIIESSSLSIDVDESSNNTFKNGSVIFSENNGIRLSSSGGEINDNSNYNSFDNVNVSSTLNHAVILDTASGSENNYNNFTNMYIDDSSDVGIYLEPGSDYNLIENVSFSSITGEGVYIESSFGNKLITNNFDSSPTVDYYLSDSFVEEFSFVSNSLEVNYLGYGGIRFLSDITESGDDLSSVISIGSNEVYVNSSGYSGFNVSANVTIKGLSLLEPKVIVDYEDDSSFEDCLDCVNLSYSGGEFKFNVSHFTTYKAGEASSLFGCGEISGPGVYLLERNLTTTGTCFNITSSDVTLDGNGFVIDGDGGASDYGITTPVDSGLVNLTIKNFGNIKEFGRGINFDMVNDSLIYNNTMKSQIAETTYAIYLQDGDSNVVEENDIEWNATGSWKGSIGVYLYSESGDYGYNNVTGNILNIHSSEGAGGGISLFAFETSNFNIFNSNILNISSPMGSTGIGFDSLGSSVSSNLIDSNIINLIGTSSSTSYGVRLSNSGNSMDSNTLRSNLINISVVSNCIGIYLYNEGGDSMESTNILNETINVYSSSDSPGLIMSSGLSLFGADDSNVSLLNINSTAPDALAADINIRAGSDSNNFETSLLQGSDYGIYVTNSHSNNFSFVNISEMRDKNAVYVSGNSNRFVDINVSSGSNLAGFNMASGTGNDFINNSVETSLVDYYTVDGGIGEFSFVSNSLEVNDSSYGAVRFLEDVTELGDDLSSVIVIGENNIFVNSSGYSGFNVSANVTIRGLSLLEPKVIVDFEDDSSFEDCLDCVNLSYSGGEFKFNVSHFTTYKAVEGDEVYGCGVLDEANSVYTLQGNVSSQGSCFSIGADNIELDCAGHSITYSVEGGASQYGIYSSGRNNVTIRNCFVIDGNESAGESPNIYRHGILLSNTNNSLVENNNVSVFGNASVGIQLSSSSNNNRLTNNIGNSSSRVGIFIYSSSNNNILTNNTGISNSLVYSAWDAGIVVYSNTDNNTLIGNNATGTADAPGLLVSGGNHLLENNIGTSESRHAIWIYESSNNTLTSNTGTSNSSAGIALSSSDYNTLTSNTGTSNSSRGIALSSSDYNNLVDNIAKSETYRGIQVQDSDYNIIVGLNASVTDGTDQAIFIYNATGNNISDCIYLNAGTEVYVSTNDIRETTNYLINCSYDVEVISGENNTLVRKWYYSAYVNDTYSDSVPNANVSQYYNGEEQFKVTTNSTGWFDATPVIAYANVGGTKEYYPLHATNDSRVQHSYVTINDNTYDGFLTIDKHVPEIEFVGDTVENGSTQGEDSVFVNVSVMDEHSNVSSFIDFDNSLVSWWRMDDVEGSSLVDYTGRNNGTIVGAEQTDAGVMGKAFDFGTRSDSYSINFGNHPSLQIIGDQTISMWIKPRNFSEGRQNPYGKAYGGEGTITQETDGRLNYYYGTAGGSTNPYQTFGMSAGNLQEGEWNHVVVVRDLGNGQLYWYWNGGLVNQGDANYEYANASSSDLIIGTNYAGSYSGSIDDVMIFNRSLSAEEIAALYANTSSRYLSHNFTSLDSGEHSFKAYTQDRAGNVNSTETRKVTVYMTEPSGYKFEIENNASVVVASVDNKGDAYIAGSKYENQGTLSPGENSFIIQNSAGEEVSYIDSSGNLYLKGIVTTVSDLSGRTSSNFEFRNSTNDLVAFFDNQGNLKLKGYLMTEYENP